MRDKNLREVKNYHELHIKCFKKKILSSMHPQYCKNRREQIFPILRQASVVNKIRNVNFESNHRKTLMIARKKNGIIFDKSKNNIQKWLNKKSKRQT